MHTYAHSLHFMCHEGHTARIPLVFTQLEPLPHSARHPRACAYCGMISVHIPKNTATSVPHDRRIHGAFRQAHRERRSTDGNEAMSFNVRTRQKPNLRVYRYPPSHLATFKQAAARPCQSTNRRGPRHSTRRWVRIAL